MERPHRVPFPPRDLHQRPRLETLARFLIPTLPLADDRKLIVVSQKPPQDPGTKKRNLDSIRTKAPFEPYASVCGEPKLSVGRSLRPYRIRVIIPSFLITPAAQTSKLSLVHKSK
jgi:hypothetical protein